MPLASPENIRFSFDEETGEIVVRVFVGKPLRYSASGRTVLYATTRGNVRMREVLSSNKIPPGMMITLNCFKELSRAQQQNINAKIAAAVDEERMRIAGARAETGMGYEEKALSGIDPALLNDKVSNPFIHRSREESKQRSDREAAYFKRPQRNSLRGLIMPKVALQDLNDLEKDFKDGDDE
jgi:hypothetical protein